MTAAAVDPARARLDAEIESIAPGTEAKAPWLIDDRLKHLDGIAKAATRDATELHAVALPDGAIQPWEIAVLTLALAEAKALDVTVSADRVASGVKLSAAEAKLLAGVREAQSKVSWAFRRLRYRGDTARIKELDAIAAGEADDVIDAHSDSERLIAIATHDGEREWFAALKCGEPEALAVLQRDHAQLGALAAKAKGTKDAEARRKRFRRLWTVITRIERRVRDAADYRYRGDAKREEYRAFTEPSTKARNAAVVAANAKKRAAAKKTAAEAKKAAAEAKKIRKKTG